MPAGARRHLVTLEGDAGALTSFSPSSLYVGVRAIGPGSSEELGNAYEVDAPFHSQITTETRLVLADGRALYVKGIRNIDERSRALVLYCEEVRTP
jgi:hypothetical protein